MISDIKSVAGSWKLNCQFSDKPTSAIANEHSKKTDIRIEMMIFIKFFKNIN